MGKKFKYLWCIVFLPITLLFGICKLIWKIFEKKKVKKYIKNISIEKLDMLDGYGLEDFLYMYFSSMGLKVEKTKKSRDYGADLIIMYKGKKIVIQCKLYYNHSVGNSAIQEIATAKNYYLADKGVVITNSFFTPSAINLSKCTNISLIDREYLANLLSASDLDKKYLLHNILYSE